jgi:hypothetical protein
MSPNILGRWAPSIPRVISAGVWAKMSEMKDMAMYFFMDLDGI